MNYQNFVNANEQHKLDYQQYKKNYPQFVQEKTLKILSVNNDGTLTVSTIVAPFVKKRMDVPYFFNIFTTNNLIITNPSFIKKLFS